MECETFDGTQARHAVQDIPMLRDRRILFYIVCHVIWNVLFKVYSYYFFLQLTDVKEDLAEKVN